MRPSGIITMTTDFGHKGPFAGVMKGVILGRFRDASVVDLGHDIPAHWPPEAGFWMSRAYPYFPAGTVHIGIVDPGVGTDRRILVAEHDGHIFMAPDNGLLGPVLDLPGASVVRRLDPARLQGLDLQTPSLTFHGRDIFAPVGAEMAAGRIAPADTGDATGDWTPGWIEPPEVTQDKVTGVVITIDAFGNLISNIDRSLLAAMQKPVALIAGHRLDLKPTYGRVPPGNYLALINSFGVLEIARAEGSAAEGLGSDRGAPVIVTDDVV